MTARKNSESEQDVDTKTEVESEQDVDTKTEVEAEKVGTTDSELGAPPAVEAYEVLTTDTTARTSDSDDVNKSWTVQEASEERTDKDGKVAKPVAFTEVEQIPGQTFKSSELPDRKVVEAAGINYDLFVAGLPVRKDDDDAPRQGIPA